MKLQPLPDDERAISPGRMLFGVVGLRRVLAPGALRITKEEFDRAVKLEPELRQVVRDFLDGKTSAEPLPEYDHGDVTKLLFQSLDEAALEDDLRQFKGNPSGDDFIKAASDAATFLKTKAPRRYRITWGGPKAVPPSQAELLPWRRYLETVGNPLWAIRQLLAGTLGRDHIEALSAVWPDVLSSVRRAVEIAKADKLEADSEWQPTRRVARQLAVLLEKDQGAPADLVQAFQNAFLQERKEQQAQKEAQAANSREDLQTPVQRVAQK